MRLALFRAAAAEGLDVVSTFVYAAPVDDAYIRTMTDVIEDHGGNLCLVQLRPLPHVLESRVTLEGRTVRQKLRDVDGLRELLERFDCYAPIDGTTLSIDNTDVTADQVTAQIRAHFGI